MIALDRDDRRVIVLLARAAETSATVTIPASALAQAIRDPARQARLARLIRNPRSEIVALGGNDAVGIGRLLSSSASADVVDAHVVRRARRAGQAVVTSDAVDLGRLDPVLRLIEI